MEAVKDYGLGWNRKASVGSKFQDTEVLDTKDKEQSGPWLLNCELMR